MPLAKRFLTPACADSSSTHSVATPIGALYVSSCTWGLHTISQDETLRFEMPDPSVVVALSQNSLQKDVEIPRPVMDCLLWLRAFFEQPNEIGHTIKPELCPNCYSTNGSFTEKVWKVLQEQVHFGSTISYSELAGLAGNPRAARAVGNAMGHNPLLLVIPCHRVVKSKGQSGSYCWGQRDHVKKWLLAHEKNYRSCTL